MYRGDKPKIFPIIVIIIVIALIIAAIASVVRMIATNGSQTTSDSAQKTDSIRDQLLNTDATSSVRWTVRGPIVADENFRSYQIEISPSKRTYTVYQGYLDKKISEKTYENNQQAYEEFVFALDKADIDQTRTVANDDMRGVCATAGRLYTFETISSNTMKSRIWTSTCEGSPGSMQADVSRVHALFVNQVPNFEPLFDRVQ